MPGPRSRTVMRTTAAPAVRPASAVMPIQRPAAAWRDADLDVDLRLRDGARAGLERLLHHLCRCDGLPRATPLAGLDAGELEDLLDHLRQAAALVADGRAVDAHLGEI